MAKGRFRVRRRRKNPLHQPYATRRVRFRYGGVWISALGAPFAAQMGGVAHAGLGTDVCGGALLTRKFGETYPSNWCFNPELTIFSREN
ncbi:hypothetical protein Poly21_30660 [Allorhodopirellula heiligendammensis]|uniref:Uncharacterized protein n=1 Tax=Allorhodopirellula heiligendammensis TaxID=2714739 RepID=A0A5C6BYC2_9BACT|nr:hypothetical protein Poly21_30660 [Allorhodopirellula heiligendammensis]